MNHQDPRWNIPGLRALIAFDSVHTARAAAREFETARDLSTLHLTAVTVPDGAVIQFVRIRDQADLELFRVPQPDDPRRDKKVFQYIEFAYPATPECIEHMRALLAGPDSALITP